jgi:hypothetical protein
VVTPEQVAQLIEVSDEDGDEGAVGRGSLPLEDGVDLESGVVGEQQLLGGGEGGVEDGERGEGGGGA